MGPLRLVPRFSSVPRQVANQAASQAAIPEDSSRARAAFVIARHVSQTFFFALERSQPDEPTDRSKLRRPSRLTHARISIKPLRPAWAVGISFSSHWQQQFNFIRASRVPCPAPRHRPASPHRLTLVRLRIRGSRREVRARARLRSDGVRFVYGHGGTVSPNSPSASLFSLLLQVVAGRLR